MGGLGELGVMGEQRVMGGGGAAAYGEETGG